MSNAKDSSRAERSITKNRTRRSDRAIAEIPNSLQLLSGRDTNRIPTSNDIAQNAKMWSVSGRAYLPSEYTTRKLPPGYYTVENGDRGIYFYNVPMNMDELLVLPDSTSEKIIQHIEFFWTREQQFRDLKFLWKRGILLHGPAGGGKTSTLQLLSLDIIERGGISIFLRNPEITARGLQILRRIEPDRPLIVLMEDIDAIIDEYGEHDLLALLDGELQIENVVFIATTNYPEDLDRRFKNRPSRFDVLQKIGLPTAAARRIFLQHKNPRFAVPENTTELELWVSESKGFAIAHLKEMILAIEALGESFESVVSRLREMNTQSLTSEDDEGRQVGFLVSGND